MITLLFASIVAGEIDNACLNQHLRKIHLMTSDTHLIGTLDERKCEDYIKNMTEIFYKLWTYHFKYQQPKENSDENIRCFVKECKKWQLHDRYLLDLLLRENESNFRKLFRRNNLLYDRLINEAEDVCNLSS